MPDAVYYEYCISNILTFKKHQPVGIYCFQFNYEDKNENPSLIGEKSVLEILDTTRKEPDQAIEYFSLGEKIKYYNDVK